ncbi:MAG: ABC transporter permease, partial [Gammaproteobacteria bacterium]|nr:ABC transporter permease [Gammaproteobacteria bacterium]
MKNVVFIAWNDVRHQLRQGGTVVWLFVMPPIFFYFIGTVMSGFSSGMSGGSSTPIVVAAESPGFLKEQIDLRLRENEFEPEWRAEVVADAEGNLPRSILTLSDNFSEQIVAGEQVDASYDTRASALLRDYETIRIQRSLYTALADIVTADARSDEPLNAAALVALNAETRVWQLEVSAAGHRQTIPVGFEQAVPGILVMFTLLVLLTSGATMLVLERLRGLLRRLASAPMTRTEVVAGKWGGRMLLAVLQVGFALIVGTFVFKMDWGPDLAMIILVLAAWAAFCASAGLLLGSLARTEGQAAGLGVLVANLLAALGGCWWPIEITPDWVQGLQKLIPTGWTMDALHKLISFQ